MAVEKFEGNLSQTTGQILAGWFLANPNGPTAYAVGFVELQITRRLFLRWMHFTGGNTWLLNSLPDEQKIDQFCGSEPIFSDLGWLVEH